MKTPNSEITQVQAETLAFIAEFRKQNGYSPTIAEMAEAASVNGNAIAGRIASMIKKGFLIKTAGVSRSIRPARRAR